MDNFADKILGISACKLKQIICARQAPVESRWENGGIFPLFIIYLTITDVKRASDIFCKTTGI